MRRGTTPTYDITISDMKNVEDVCLAFEQTSSGVMLAKHVSDMLAIYDYLHKRQIKEREHALRYQELYKK